MKEFTYTIKDENGIHARPAGMLVKKAREFKSTSILSKNGKSAELTKLMALMSLGVKCGDTVTVSVSGSDEEIAAESIKKLLNEIL